MSRTLVSKKTGVAVTPTTILGTCSQDIAVGNAVLLINGIWQKADCTILQKIPASGLVVEKTGNTGCRVASFGAIKLPYPLVIGKNYYVGLNGLIIPNEPSPSQNNFVYSQQVGTATGINEIMLNIKEAHMLQPSGSYHTFINTRKNLMPGK